MLKKATNPVIPTIGKPLTFVVDRTPISPVNGCNAYGMGTLYLRVGGRGEISGTDDFKPRNPRDEL